MICELDTVVLTHDIPEHGLCLGDVGTAVHVYPGASSFEVEFVTGDGHTVALLTLSSADVRQRHDKEILHARDMSGVR